MNTPFGDLVPETILEAVEKHCDIFLDGSITPYNSYINRVFGVKDDNENDYIVKFYRPGRWSRAAVLDEHQFLSDCAAAEIPVVPPILSASGESAPTAAGCIYAVFPRLRARTFDIAGDEDWIRIGSVIGRMHQAGKRCPAPNRISCTPQETTLPYIQTLKDENLVHPDFAGDFFSVCEQALEKIIPLFESLHGSSAMQRIHGDCHRGNILENRDRLITLIDFDDMMTGPAVQDLWLLLPGHLEDSMSEMNLMIEGYEQFCPFDRRTLALVEPLRFMRHLYFLNWCAIQRNDTGFAERNPDWGSRAFWLRETEDLSNQLANLDSGDYI